MNNITERNTHLYWRMDKRDRPVNYGSMAEGYHLAALRLLDSLIDNNSGHDADVVMFPILFSGHQSIELYLKAISILVAEANGENPWQAPIKDTHNIQRLLDSLNSKLPDNEKITKNVDTKSLFTFIDICMQIGDDSSGSYYVDFSRYPEHLANHNTPRRSYYFVLNDDNTLIINISKIRTIIDEACSLLGGLYAQWLDRAQYVRDKPGLI